MKLENPLSSYVQLSDLQTKHFDTQVDTSQSILSALEVLDNKLSDDEFVQANSDQIAKALSSIIYKFGGCLIWGKYSEKTEQTTWEASSILDGEVYGDILIQQGKLVENQSYIQMIDDLDMRLNNVDTSVQMDDYEAAKFVNKTILQFDASRRDEPVDPVYPI